MGSFPLTCWVMGSLKISCGISCWWNVEMERMLMICWEYVEIMLIFAQYSIHILSNQQLVTSTVVASAASWPRHDSPVSPNFRCTGAAGSEQDEVMRLTDLVAIGFNHHPFSNTIVIGASFRLLEMRNYWLLVEQGHSCLLDVLAVYRPWGKCVDRAQSTAHKATSLSKRSTNFPRGLYDLWYFIRGDPISTEVSFILRKRS